MEEMAVILTCQAARPQSEALLARTPSKVGKLVASKGKIEDRNCTKI